MVDRITPQTTDDDRREVKERFGIDDAWPVVCEPFTQWVLEDHFTLGRPPYEDVGAQLVPDVEPYELMKLRLLNASHQALCYFAYLDGYRLVHEAAQDPLYRTFLRGYMDHEGTPTLRARPRRRPRRLQGDADRALLQPRGPRHRRPPVRGVQRPHPEVAAARGPPQPRARRRDRAQRRRRGQLGALRRGHRRAAASRSRSSTSSRTASPPTPRTARSSRIASCSATSPTTTASAPPTRRRWTHCTSTAPAGRSSATRACSRRRRRAPSRS